MFDSPKAAHFDVFLKGEILSPNDPFGLDMRWAIARRCEVDGVHNMISLTPEEHGKIDSVLCDFNVSWNNWKISANLRN